MIGSMDLARLQPQLFEDFKNILQSDRMNHAYLFSGNFASFDMALYLAKSRFCEDLQNHLPCGNCRTCRLIAAGEFSDVRVIEPQGQVIKTETIKEAMHNFSRSGYEGASQVFIIKDCEKMHINAANSLLKFIEEPQSDSYIILLTSDDNKVLPTIKSRTQIFRFPKQLDLLVRAAEKEGFLKDQAQLLAEVAKDFEHLKQLMQTKKLVDAIPICQRFVLTLIRDRQLAYLGVAKLAVLLTEKNEQDIAFQWLALLLSKNTSNPNRMTDLDKVYRAHQMWKSNVSFQNVLEYMVIS